VTAGEAGLPIASIGAPYITNVGMDMDL